MQKIFKFEELKTADLIIDAIYKGGQRGNASDDPLNKLIGCSNSAGFRPVGSLLNWQYKYIVLYSSLSDIDWPDYLDEETGQFIYYGDNKKPGYDLHDTPKNGNRILSHYFEITHSKERKDVIPFFIFTKAAEGRDMAFKGLAVPGYPGVSPAEDLVAIWKTKSGQRFQNYKAIFTILDIPIIERKWINDLISGNALSINCSKAYKKWVNERIYTPLYSIKTKKYRTKVEQIPNSLEDIRIIELIYDTYKDNPFAFEKRACELVKLMDQNIFQYDVTRPWMDGGRDAVGKYRIGLNRNEILVDFALEAKCYNLNNAVGVKETSRLISRLRYRQFGILVTTSYVHQQAYKEIIEDNHPVIIIAAKDIIEILRNSNYKTLKEVKNWLEGI